MTIQEKQIKAKLIQPQAYQVKSGADKGMFKSKMFSFAEYCLLTSAHGLYTK